MLETENQIDLFDDVANPLDGVEEIMFNNDWVFDRHTEDEMTVTITGKYGHYKLDFHWEDNYSALRFFCTPDIHIHKNNIATAMETLNQINNDMWLGYFDVIANGKSDDHFTPRFRHTSLFRGLNETSGIPQMEDMIDIAINECERFYPCFDLLSHHKIESKKAPSLAVMDVEGLS